MSRPLGRPALRGLTSARPTPRPRYPFPVPQQLSLFDVLRASAPPLRPRPARPRRPRRRGGAAGAPGRPARRGAAGPLAARRGRCGSSSPRAACGSTWRRRSCGGGGGRWPGSPSRPCSAWPPRSWSGRGRPAPRGGSLLDVFAQRAARAEPSLRRGLEDLADGFATVTGTVRDLLDAGLEPVHAEAVEEALASDGPFVASRAEVERARALVRSAARAEARDARPGPRPRLDPAPPGRRAGGDRREAALPARAILIHGFADATGVATDLIQALLRRRGAWLILDHPPKPEGERGLRAGVHRPLRRAARRISAGVETAPPPPARSRSAPRRPSRRWGPRPRSREVARRDPRPARRRRPARGDRRRGPRPRPLPLRPAPALRPPGHPLLGSGRARRAGAGRPPRPRPPGAAARGRGGALRPLARRRGRSARGAPLARPAGGARRRLVDLRLAFAALGAGRLRDVTELRLEEVLRKGSYRPAHPPGPADGRRGRRTPGRGGGGGIAEQRGARPRSARSRAP